MQPQPTKSYVWIYRLLAVLAAGYIAYNQFVAIPAFVDKHNAAFLAVPVGGHYPDDSMESAIVFYFAPLTAAVLAILFSLLAFRSSRKTPQGKATKAINTVTLIAVLCIVMPLVSLMIMIMFI